MDNKTPKQWFQLGKAQILSPDGTLSDLPPTNTLVPEAKLSESAETYFKRTRLPSSITLTVHLDEQSARALMAVIYSHWGLHGAMRAALYRYWYLQPN